MVDQSDLYASSIEYGSESISREAGHSVSQQGGSSPKYPGYDDEQLQRSHIPAHRMSPASSSSMDSITSSLSSFSAASSASSFIAEGGGDQLIKFLKKDAELNTIFKTLVEKVGLDKFQKILQRCLVQFSAHIKSEVTSPVMIRSARFIKKHSRNAAASVRLELQSRNIETRKFSDNSGERPEAALDDLKSETEESDDDLDEGTYTNTIEGDVAATISFQLLKENLELFIRPDTIRKLLYKLWPPTIQRSSSLPVNYDICWELPEYLRTHFEMDQDIGMVLTITGEVMNAEAKSCREYLLSSWPTLALPVLEGLKEFLQSFNEGRKGASKLSRLLMPANTV
jgi:hypothetical protein